MTEWHSPRPLQQPPSRRDVSDNPRAFTPNNIERNTLHIVNKADTISAQPSVGGLLKRCIIEVYRSCILLRVLLY
jgi:hypothetical protein